MNRRRLGLAVMGAVLLSGCGGGGTLTGNPGGNNGGQSGSVNVFLTDSFETDHSHVWATIYRVDVVATNGSSETVFNDSAGRLVDLKTLRDSSGGRFLFLGRTTVSGNVQSNVRITVGNTLQLFRTGETVVRSTPISSTVPRDANGNPVLSFALIDPRNLAGGDLVADFDLANFAIVNNAVTPALQQGSAVNLNAERQERREFRGIVANLSGSSLSNFTFTLNGLAVATSTDTVLFNASNTPNPTLANAKVVEVVGTFDTAAQRVSATRVQIEDADLTNAVSSLAGAPSSLDAAKGTFRLEFVRVRNFLPTETVVAVQTAADTIFRSNNGAPLTSADFFTLLAQASGAEVEGTYNATTKIFTAIRTRIDDARSAKRVELTGTPTLILAASRVFRVDPVLEADGFVPNGQVITVSANSSTTYADKDGTAIAANAFFAALADTNRVKVHGTPNSANGVTALRLQLKASQ